MSDSASDSSVDSSLFPESDIRSMLHLMAAERLLHCGLLAMGVDHMLGTISNSREVCSTSAPQNTQRVSIAFC